MNATDAIVDQAIAKIEAEEAGLKPDDTKKESPKDADTGKSESKEDAGKSTDDAPAEVKYDKDGKRIENAEDDKKVDDDEEESKEGEFTADDAVETEEPKQEAPKEAPKDATGIVLSAAEQQYIVQNIGEPLVIRGTRGVGDDAKEVEIKVFSPQEIPADFKFASEQQLLVAQEGFRRLENKAQDLLGKFRQDQSSNQAADFERRENESIREDIAELQKAGRFPKFTVRPGEANFDDSPEAKQVTDVLKFMNERNQYYLEQYNQGRAYRHIGFAEAFSEWERTNPDRQASKKAAEDQRAEDEARKSTAENGQSNRGMSSTNIVKPTVAPGTTTRDILARIDNDESF
jgi:hypothetical protein